MKLRFDTGDLFYEYSPPSSCEFISGLLAGAGSLASGALGFLGSSNAASAASGNLNKLLAYLNSVTTMNRTALFPWMSTGTNAESILGAYLGLPTQAIAAGVDASGNPTYGNAFQANAPLQGTPLWGSLLESPQAFSTNILGVPLAGAPTPYQMPAFGIQQFQASPGYAYQLSQGVDAIQNAAGPTQGVLSGNTLEALQKYGTGLANQDWWNWLTNQQNIYNQGYQANNANYWQQVQAAAGTQSNIFNDLYNIATGGQNAANQSNPSQAVTNQVGNAFTNLAQVAAQGQAGMFKALAGLFNPTSAPTSSPTPISNFGNALTNLFNGGTGSSSGYYSGGGSVPQGSFY